MIGTRRGEPRVRPAATQQQRTYKMVENEIQFLSWEEFGPGDDYLLRVAVLVNDNLFMDFHLIWPSLVFEPMISSRLQFR